jgi:hypothetical protein
LKTVRRLLLVLQGFVGIGALAGGLAAITNPNAPMGVTTEALKNSPFSNFLIPGIILFTIIGIGNIISAITLWYDFRFQCYISCVFSWALVIWIIVQCIMLQEIVYLHVIFFIIGLVEVVLSAVILFNQRLFPAGLIISFAEKLRMQR